VHRYGCKKKAVSDWRRVWVVVVVVVVVKIGLLVKTIVRKVYEMQDH
jgi:hypothetical protein